ncbi:DUF6069 family protein [Microbacterium horticulturae]|uniref:DUF6069 family protein n=1 Tax=Microbacterium horticulturae TaxID=3028316 RepID=A0ABY8BZL2_9MICO|nr:DUF6069 family protein [Microbacterium sp. KACC 23027]WEG08912.1 DUF6069 family protein [Microbacterium sp. KACC 23027]
MTGTSSSPLADAAPTPARASLGYRIGVLTAAIVVAVALNAGIAAIAVAAGAPPQFAPLTLPVYAAFTIVPMLLGWFAWRAVSRRVSNPRRTMPLLAAAVLVVSYIPDVLLLVTGFIPGTTVAGVVALMAMHVVVISVALAGYTLAGRR